MLLFLFLVSLRFVYCYKLPPNRGLKQPLLIYSLWLEMWLTVEVLSALHRALGFFPSTAKVRNNVPHVIKVIVG